MPAFYAPPTSLFAGAKSPAPIAARSRFTRRPAGANAFYAKNAV